MVVGKKILSSHEMEVESEAMVEREVSVNPISAASLYLEFWYKNSYSDVRLAVGTGFCYLHNGTRYLVSNWHNFSGRKPENKKALRRDLALPNRIKVHGRNQDDLSQEKIVDLDLLNDDQGYLWLQHPVHKEKVDIGVLPIPLECPLDDIDINSAINEIDPHEKWPIEVGEQLFVVGYPFGISDACNLPIWKAATLASEPGIDQDKLPLLYIDTSTRKGMSGSPVINYRRRSISLVKGEQIYRFHAEFLGVYSGRIVADEEAQPQPGRIWTEIDDILLEAQLGKIWRANAIDDIIEGNHFYAE